MFSVLTCSESVLAGVGGGDKNLFGKGTAILGMRVCPCCGEAAQPVLPTFPPFLLSSLPPRPRPRPRPRSPSGKEGKSVSNTPPQTKAAGKPPAGSLGAGWPAQGFRLLHWASLLAHSTWREPERRMYLRCSAALGGRSGPPTRSSLLMRCSCLPVWFKLKSTQILEETRTVF